ncbi:hypothetical protein QCA50_014866 [Cerrena zonata]|uniref:G protein-coupled receptor n=1 Tax=Cerrena zonata TaxID=2478898 RepID=A0AAW0FS76_9APHY
MATGSYESILHLAFLDQRLKYLSVATVSLQVYDTLLSLLDDIRLLSMRSIRLPYVIYCLSRIITTAEVGLVCATLVLPTKSCVQGHLLLAVGCLTTILVPCNTWLFFLRVRAIPNYFYSRATVAICAMLWASTLTSFLAIRGLKISTLRYQDGTCGVEISYRYVFLCIPFFALVIFDTAVIVATSIGLVVHGTGSSWTGRLKSGMLTRDMGHISGLFLRSGQIYYVPLLEFISPWRSLLLLPFQALLLDS